MTGAAVLWIVMGIVVVVGFYVFVFSPPPSNTERPVLTDAERAALAEGRERVAHGAPRPQIVCPHCLERGNVQCKTVHNKKGISGGKATAAVLTGGFSVLATGLSRKEAATEAYCNNCQSVWQF